MVEYCGNFFGFSGKDDLGDCSDPKVLCVAASIDVADRKNPPSSTDLKDCDTCFVQPFKIFVDTVVPNTTEPPNGTVTCQSINIIYRDKDENKTCGMTTHTNAGDNDGLTCYSGGVACDSDSKDTCGASCINGECVGGETCSGKGIVCVNRTWPLPRIKCGSKNDRTGQGCDRDSDCQDAGYSRCDQSTGICY